MSFSSLIRWLFSPWHTDRSLHYTPIHALHSQRFGGELPAPLHQEGTQPPRVNGLHYGFLPSLELDRVLPIRLNAKRPNPFIVMVGDFHWASRCDPFSFGGGGLLLCDDAIECVGDVHGGSKLNYSLLFFWGGGGCHTWKGFFVDTATYRVHGLHYGLLPSLEP